MSNGQEQSLVERLREKTGGGVGTDLMPTQTVLQPISAVATMLAAQAKAAVQARFELAQYRPRNWDDVRVKVIAECKRPAFAANKSAYYSKPRGTSFDHGLGIRFVEVALRCMTNIFTETVVLHDDDRMRILQITMTDLESNETWGRMITVAKTVERSNPLEDGTFISVRKNAKGYPVYTVPARDDEIVSKEAAQVSIQSRVLGLRIIPGDLQDECKEIILKVRATTAAEDPAAERKRIADAFSEINVRPSDLTAYLGHDFGACSPAELVMLRGLFGAIRDGQTTWATVLDQVRAEKAGNGSPAPAKASQSTTGADAGAQRGPARGSDPGQAKPSAADPPSAPSPQPSDQSLIHGTGWPHLGADGLWRDSTGTTFREDQHGWNTDEKRPSVTAQGVFRARRGSGQGQAPAPPPRTVAGLGPPGPASSAAHERAENAQQERGLREEEGW